MGFAVLFLSLSGCVVLRLFLLFSTYIWDENVEEGQPMNQEKAEKIPVAASEPYPPIKVEGKNHHYAQLLGQDLASSWGEMSAIYGYLYQHWILNKPQAALQTVLFRIAKVEMHHLNILGQLIRMLGGDPKCIGIPPGTTRWYGMATWSITTKVFVKF